MIKVNLSECFKLLLDSNYVLIKPANDVLDYNLGSDLDIFCYDIEDISLKVLSFLNDFAKNNLCEIKIVDNVGQRYIDLIQDGEINIRFDLYSSLPYYENLRIKNALFPSVIENCVITTKFSPDVEIKVPCDVDDLILRYIEYQEWFSQRPDKIKHIDYIYSLYSEQDIKYALDKLHYYIVLPAPYNKPKTVVDNITEFFRNSCEGMKKIVPCIKIYGFLSTLKIIFKKF